MLYQLGVPLVEYNDFVGIPAGIPVVYVCGVYDDTAPRNMGQFGIEIQIFHIMKVGDNLPFISRLFELLGDDTEYTAVDKHTIIRLC